MKRALLAVIALVASLLAATVPAGADTYVYCGANDVVYPTISKVTLSPTNVTVGKANKLVTMTVKASDDCAVSHIEVVLAPKGRPTNNVVYVTAFHLTSGTTKSGTWTGKKTLLDEQYGGVWYIDRVNVTDTYYNEKQSFVPPGTIHIRHVTALTLKKPKSPVHKKATIVGRLHAYGDFGTWQVKIQKHAPGKKWKTVTTMTTNAWGDFGLQVKITGTTYFRVVHAQDNTTVASTSPTVKVKVKH